MIEHRYLEIEEQFTNPKIAEKLPTMLRLEVTDLRQAQILFHQYKHLFDNKKFRSQFHQHFHGHNENLPCKLTIIKEQITIDANK